MIFRGEKLGGGGERNPPLIMADRDSGGGMGSGVTIIEKYPHIL